MSANNFKTLKEAFDGFHRNALSDFTPPAILKGIEGGFYAGAQSALTLLTEALDIDATIAHSDVVKIFAECQTFFELARIASLQKVEAKRGKKKDKEQDNG